MQGLSSVMRQGGSGRARWIAPGPNNSVRAPGYMTDALFARMPLNLVLTA